jgi:phosphopantetheinyl transferase (holo-ACP synthase)
MNFTLEKCMVEVSHLSVSGMREILRYSHLMTCVLLDLRLLDGEVKKLGKDKIITSSLSGQEVVLLDKFTSAKRQKEWIGGRFAAKYATAKLLKQGDPQQNISWSSLIIDADENSRPFLSSGNDEPGNTMPDISISHSGSMAAAMAIEKGLCGIDIQQVTPKIMKVRNRFCTREELKILEKSFSMEPETPLTLLWAAKETLRKASNLDSLPGFMELQLLEITTDPSAIKSGPWCFILNWKNAGGAKNKCTVAVTQIEDYALALTVRDDTVA